MGLQCELYVQSGIMLNVRMYQRKFSDFYRRVVFPSVGIAIHVVDMLRRH